MSYDVYVNLHYNADVIRRLIDQADRVEFFGDGDTAQFTAAQFAIHNDRFRDASAHAYLRDLPGADANGHGFILIVNRAGESAALHDAGPGDFAPRPRDDP